MRRARSIRRGVAAALVALAALRAGPALPQTEEDLTSARKLFAEAVADEEAKRYDTALEKFRRVAAVRDTANVRYRIATCLEALGRRAEALTSYEAAQRLGAGDRSSAEVARAAGEHATQLDRVVPRLSIVLPPGAPAGTEVRVDDTVVDPASLGQPLPLDAGRHTIAATAPGDLPFRTAVTLPEGGRLSIGVTLEPIPAVTPEGSARATGSGAPPPPPPPLPPAESHGPPAGAWVAFGVGGALAAGSVISLALRQVNLTTLTHDCGPPNSSGYDCPSSLGGEVHSAHDAAAIEGPLGIGLAVGAAVSLGFGVWLLTTPPSNGVHVTPAVSPRGAAILIGGPIDR
jgi:hypothetical protein